jgi:hypothetical protein
MNKTWMPGLSLIVLAAACIIAPWYYREVVNGDSQWLWYTLVIGVFSTPILAAIGVLFLLRRVHLAIAIIVSIVVMLVGYPLVGLWSILVFTD